MEHQIALQIKLWGCAQHGPNETAATVAEGRHAYRHEWAERPHRWDHDAEWLSHTLNCTYGESRPWRAWSALPWVSEHCLRGHADWPGL